MISRRNRQLLCVVMNSAMLAPAMADQVPRPPDIASFSDVTPTLALAPNTKLLMGKLTIELERTTLDEIRKSIGVGAIGHRGDAADSEYWLCYTLPPRSGSRARVWLSSGELGGAKHAIGGIHASAISKPETAVPACPLLPAQLRPVSLESRLWLGSTSAKLERVLGKPSAKRDGWWLYSYGGKSAVSEFDRSVVLGAHLKSGRIDQLFAFQTTTD